MSRRGLGDSFRIRTLMIFFLNQFLAALAAPSLYRIMKVPAIYLRDQSAKAERSFTLNPVQSDV
jgi:hypothetical protein